MERKKSALYFGYNDRGKPQARLQGGGNIVDFTIATHAAELAAIEAIYNSLFDFGKADVRAKVAALLVELDKPEV